MMRTTIFIASLLLFASGVILSFRDSVAAATATYSAAVLSLIFVFLPEFKRFKGLGIEAELLDKKIEEADKLLSHLRDLAIPIAEMLWSSAARIGRWNSAMPRAQTYELVEKIERELLRCGVTPAQLESAKADWHYYNLLDLIAPVRARLSEALKAHLDVREKAVSNVPQPIAPSRKDEFERLVAERNVVSQELEATRQLHEFKEPSELAGAVRSMISDSGVLSSDEKQKLIGEISEELQDIDYYAEHKQFRRLRHWLRDDEEA